MNIKGISGIFNGKEFTVTDALVFGRNEETCDVVFSGEVPGISSVHCKIEIGADGTTITDQDSSNGTFLNGNKIQPNVPQQLNNGDTFYLGDAANSFIVSGIEAAKAEVDPASMSAKEIIRIAFGNNKIKIAVIAAAVIFVFILITLILESGSFVKMNNEINRMQQEITTQQQEIARQQQEIARQQQEIGTKQQEVDQKTKELSEQQAITKQKEQELSIKQQEIDQLQSRFNAQKDQITEKQSQIDDYNNRSSFERIIDGIGGGIDLFSGK